MTTLAQIKRVTRPLLERNSDLALVGRVIIVKPVRHLLRGVFFGRGTNPIVFDPRWFVNFLFKPGAGITDTWGGCLYSKKGVRLDPGNEAMIRDRIRITLAQMALPSRERRYPESWGGWVSYDPAIAQEMCEVIEQQALPMLRDVQSIDDFVAFTSDKARFGLTYFGSNYFDEPFVYAARGDFEPALAICAKIAARDSTRPQVQELLPLLSVGDRSGLARLLHTSEANAVKRLRLEEYWEPTPFPIEAAA